MNRNTRVIFIVCVAAVAVVLALQSGWLVNYYQVNKERFEKDANLAFEDAIKTEFRQRNDTIEEMIYRYVMDTNRVMITSSWKMEDSSWVYMVADKLNKKDRFSFSLKQVNEPILSQSDSVKELVARRFTKTYREEDLERHIVFFRTQAIGHYIDNKAREFGFDTARLRPIYLELLAERDIREPFLFLMADEDSTLNRSRFPDSLRLRYPIITKSFPTYRAETDVNYVRALFRPPFNYLLGKMIGMVIASLILLTIVVLALWYLLRIIRREKKLSAIKNDFISNISHELKTPIATITAAVDALEGFGALQCPEKTKRYLNISREELQRLTEMVNKILNLSVYERQDFALNPEAIDVNEMVESITSRHTLAGSKEIAFHYLNLAGTTSVQADRVHLYNVVNNLIDNAVKYSADKVVIDICFYRENGYNFISVKDDGIGIAAGDLQHVFDKFYRVPSGNIHKVKGYGLGLNYVKHIIERHGGWCMAESTPGKGSIFKIAWQL
ncbi:ATP-binding protein [Paraflavitalea sp. CAU 1676]|uniref:sensor histidine kinase n=1 Tax=Paraflavitalea sp. CAU 1676 TaxID=3032598 RepID=UPI0023DC5888|nr:ATP-binding protein [Paraflavitalea sp. CAU 1676]MDF2190486.1 ATP-binding protein [Paraflavitalea sp. CAU 1676]